MVLGNLLSFYQLVNYLSSGKELATNLTVNERVLENLPCSLARPSNTESPTMATGKTLTNLLANSSRARFGVFMHMENLLLLAPCQILPVDIFLILEHTLYLTTQQDLNH